MTEDEEFENIASYQKMQRLVKARELAVTVAERLCKQHKDSLGHMTLRKAFELGFMEAHNE